MKNSSFLYITYYLIIFVDDIRLRKYIYNNYKDKNRSLVITVTLSEISAAKSNYLTKFIQISVGICIDEYDAI